MSLRRRRPADGPPAAAGPSEETQRARAAAREAAIQLNEVRAQRGDIDRSARELDDLNRHNGFYTLIRQAWGA